MRCLLVGLDHEDDVARQWHLVLGQYHHRAGEHRHAALEVDRAASVDMAVLMTPPNGSTRPLLPLDADDVGVRGQQNRTFAAVALQPGNEVRLASFGRRHDRRSRTPAA